MPRTDPMPVVRTTGPRQRRRSSREGSSRPIWATATLRDSGFSRLRRISAIPNTPIASTAKSIPSDRSAIPSVNRSWPVSRSVPTVASNRPNTTMMIALSTEPRASTIASPSPNTMRPKYSAGPNSKASLVSGAPMAAMTRVATEPAKKEASAAVPSATPAWPFFAVLRHHVAVERSHDRSHFPGHVDQDGGEHGHQSRWGKDRF